MVRICDMISTLQMGNKKYHQPEWWYAQHKLKKEVKRRNLYKMNLDLRFSYRANLTTTNDAAKITDKYSSGLNLPDYSELAPWDKYFRKFTTLILSKK